MMDRTSAMQLQTCHNLGGNQMFVFTSTNDIRFNEYCLDGPILKGPVTMIKCHNMGGNQKWTRNEKVKIYL